MLTRFLEPLVEASTVSDVRDAYFDAMAEFGFVNAFYAARFMLALPESVIREEIEVFSNFPKSFADTLMSRNLLTTSPWADWAMRNSGSVAARDLENVGRTAAGSEAMELATRHGLHAGRIISLRNKVMRSNGAIVLNPFAGATHEEVDDLWARSSRQITALSLVMHMRMATIHRHGATSRLTTRQREVLEWSSAGKTVSEIATILGLTPATIEKHLRLARDTLGAGSTAQAILKAHVTHQIFMQKSEENYHS